VWLSAATDVSAGGDGLAVRVRFSVPVVGFESNDVMVQVRLSISWHIQLGWKRLRNQS
jgi:hypothetical protein